jgi:EpsI family protein
MVLASYLAYHFTPRQYLADHRPKIHLDTMVPKEFGRWRVDPSITPVVADPSQAELIDQLYSETLSRTYVNERGQRVMLTIAYGRDQSESVQLHTPEFCYRAQGYTVAESKAGMMPLGFKDQPVIQVLASAPRRIEPITYWVIMGDHVVNGGVRDRRDLRFIYGFRGLIPDGMLFRVSSIGDDTAIAYALQGLFVADLMSKLSKVDRNRLTGEMSFRE